MLKYIPGYAYHIKDSYFVKASDPMLMQNKEGGAYRPTYFCVRDPNTSLLWMVPMSTRYAKYAPIVQKQAARYGQCISIVLGTYDGQKAAFLIQNVFPVTDDYIDHVHIKNGNPIPVPYSVQQEVRSKLKRVLLLHKQGKKIVFTDIARLEQLMRAELSTTRP